MPEPALAALRGDPYRRPQVDHCLVRGLREWLEDGVGAAARELPPGSPPVRIDRHSGRGPSSSHPQARLDVPRARGALLGALFRQLVATGRIDDPIADAVEALAAGGDEGEALLDLLRCLTPAQRASVRREVTAAARRMVGQWGPVPSSWRPRTRDRVAIPLCGGRVVLSDTLDLVLGTAPVDRRSVCIVNLSPGADPESERQDRHFAGLLETLRSGAPPFRLATYRLMSGELEREDVTDEMLFSSVRRVIRVAAEQCGPGRSEATAA